MKSFEIDDAINMFEQAIEQQDTDFPNECRKIVGWLRELKWWRSHVKNCTSCKYENKARYDEPCSTCENWKNWECGYEEATKREDVPDINVGK